MTEINSPSRSKVGSSRPDIALKIVSLVTDPTVDFQVLRDELSKDIGLVMQTLRLANSAAYGLPRKVESLDRAVVMLGARTIGNIALAASMDATFNIFPESIPHLTGKQLHHHSLQVAQAAEIISRYASLDDISSEAFVAGLLHDIGIIDLAWEHPEELTELLNRAEGEGILMEEVVRREAELVGGMENAHPALGMKAGIEWGLPPGICSAIGYHHHPLETSEHYLLVAVVALAEIISGFAHPGVRLDGSGQEVVMRKLLSRIRISPEEWDTLTQTVQARINPPEDNLEEAPMDK